MYVNSEKYHTKAMKVAATASGTYIRHMLVHLSSFLDL